MRNYHTVAFVVTTKRHRPDVNSEPCAKRYPHGLDSYPLTFHNHEVLRFLFVYFVGESLQADLLSYA